LKCHPPKHHTEEKWKMAHFDGLHLISDPLRTSSLKEKEVGAMGEESLGEPNLEEGWWDQ
jgi:hypothetical protein